MIFVIRTRGSPWRSRPHPLLATLAAGTALLGMILPLTPLGPVFGFVAPPPIFYLFVVAAVLVYLMLVEAVKQAFYRFMARHPT